VAEPGNGNRVYAFNTTGLWLSRDGADSWRSLQTGLGRPPQAVALDPFQPGRIFALVWESLFEGVIYRSDDFGNRWTPVFRTGLIFSAYPASLVADPFTKDTLFWIAEDDHLYRSRDAGQTWSCVFVTRDCTFGNTEGLTTVAIAPDPPKTLYAVGDQGRRFHVSRDDGRTWTTSAFTVPYLEVLVATREPRTLYAWSRYRPDPKFIDACFARSDDEGETWKGILGHRKCGAPAIDPGDPRTVRMVVVSNRVPQLWVSRNGGDTWTSAGAVPGLGDLYIVPGGGLALATDRGFFRAPGDEGPWRTANRGLAAAHVGAVLPLEETVLAAPFVFEPEPTLDTPPVSLLRTGDGGRSWESEPLTNPLALAADPSDPFHLLASAVRLDESGFPHYRILESRDKGRTWRGVVDPQASHPFATPLAVDPFLPQTFYAGAGGFSGGFPGGLYRSDDGGRTWRDSSAGLPRPRCFSHGCVPRQVHTILTDPTQAGRMFIRLHKSIYRSLDYGITWTQLRTHRGSSGGAVFALARDPQGALIAIDTDSLDDFMDLGVVYRSTDHGATWTRQGRLSIRTLTGMSTYLTGFAATEGALWVSSPLGIFLSTDGGRTWRSANAGLPLLSVTSLVTDPADPSRLYATIPGNGIYTLAAP
jgi:photosystem II stability/assembly factor-like uncharacterized protein